MSSNSRSYYLPFLTSLLTFVYALTLLGQSTLAPYFEELERIKLLENPIARDTQLITQQGTVCEELARYKDTRAPACLDTLLAMVEASDWDASMGIYYRAMARYYDFSNSDGDKALEYYDKSISALSQSNTDPYQLAFTYTMKGFFLHNSGLPEEALKVLETALPYAEKTKHKNTQCLILDFFADLRHYDVIDGYQDLDKALELYLQVGELLPLIKYDRIIAGHHTDLFFLYNTLGNKVKSEFHFQKADSVLQKAHLPHGLADLYVKKGAIHHYGGEPIQAALYFHKLENVLKKSDNKEFVSRFQRDLYEYNKDIRSYKKSLNHLEIHHSMEEDLKSEVVQKKYKEIESKYNLAVKDGEIQELKQATLTKTRNLLIALLGILIASSILIWRKNRALKRSYKTLEDKQDEVEQAIYEGETQERQRVAAELHDNVNTKLAAIRWRLEAISDEVTGHSKDILLDTIDMMNEAYQDVRHVSHNLVPEQLENEGLIASVDNLLWKLNSGNKLKFSLVSSSIDESLISNIIYPIYNITFELINNVLKHADADECNIEFTTTNKNIKLSITDNGRGFDVDKMRKGYGLRSIITRVKTLAGELNIVSSPNKGSTTEITIPFKMNALTA